MDNPKLGGDYKFPKTAQLGEFGNKNRGFADNYLDETLAIRGNLGDMQTLPTTHPITDYTPFQGTLAYNTSGGGLTVTLVIGQDRNIKEGWKDVIHYGTKVKQFRKPESIELPEKFPESEGDFYSDNMEENYEDFKESGYSSSGNDGPDGFFAYYKIEEDSNDEIASELLLSPIYPVNENLDADINIVYWVLGKIIPYQNVSKSEALKGSDPVSWKWRQYWTGGQIIIAGTGGSVFPRESCIAVIQAGGPYLYTANLFESYTKYIDGEIYQKNQNILVLHDNVANPLISGDLIQVNPQFIDNVGL
ncbi:MAG: hypothetical protein U9Q38_02640 [Thermodesulfobacteriota bacterium]|nr:hypothetical protein [Thermodesulfobacteriota bacterium]